MILYAPSLPPHPPTHTQQIKEVRLATKVEKRSKAMALRAKELGALGMQVCCVAMSHHAAFNPIYHGDCDGR